MTATAIDVTVIAQHMTEDCRQQHENKSNSETEQIYEKSTHIRLNRIRSSAKAKQIAQVIITASLRFPLPVKG